LKKHGKKKWQKHVADVVERLVAALEPDEVVLGGGDVKKLKKLPKGCRAGDNANAFLGGFRLWENTTPVASSTRARSRGQQSTRLGQQIESAVKELLPK
jgi:predicted NBD/HSP70 family sugar kinase